MAVFAIISEGPAAPQLRTAIESKYPTGFRHWSDRVSFVVASGPAQTVSDTLGIKTRLPDGRVSDGLPDVIVTQLGPTYWGWTGSDFWAWLADAHLSQGG